MLSAKVKDTSIHVGDTVRVHSTVVEGSKSRIQIFEGILISLNGRLENAMMTVRRIGTGGMGVERKWPLNARSIVKIEIKKQGNPKRSKLYYLRNLTGQSATRV